VLLAVRKSFWPVITLLQLAFVGNLEYGCENVKIYVIDIRTGGGGKITMRF